eukprot:6486647-Amphidinium_carterae.1
MASTRSPSCGPLGYLSINVNENLVLLAHRDLHNLDSSWLCAAGPYTGGLLWVEALESELDEECVALPSIVQGPAPSGLMGHLLDPRGQWVQFDGRRWHAVLPAQGRRLSVTLFSPRGYLKLAGEHWTMLSDLGFGVEPLLRARVSNETSPLSDADGAIMRDLLSKIPVPCASRGRTPLAEKNNCVDELLCCLQSGPACDFSDFLCELRRLCRGEFTRRSSSSLGSSSSAFPSGIPFLAEFAGRSAPPASRRRASRWHCEHRVRMMVNYVVVYLQWLHVSQPAAGLLAERIAFQADAACVVALRPVINSVRAWCRSKDSIPVDGGLSRTCSMLMERVAKEGHLGSYSNVNDGLFDSTSVATPDVASTLCLTPGAISLPSQSALIPLKAPTVPKTIERLLESEGSFARDPVPSAIARSFMNVSSWPAIASELVSSGLGTLRPPEHCPQFNLKRVAAGLFGVPKKGTDKSRLIIDRRPANSLELSVRETILNLFKQGRMDKDEFLFLSDLMTLPYCGQFVRLLAPQTTEIRTFTEDAADYYYNLALPESLCIGNAVGPLVDGSKLVGCASWVKEACDRFGFHELWSVHLTAPPMGDVKAPDIAQCVHAFVCLQYGGLLPWSWLRYHQPCSGDALWSGCYVDDYALISLQEHRARGCMHASHTAFRAKAIMSGVHKGYTTTGITRKVAKATSDEVGGTMWGAHLDGKEHSVSTPVEKRQLLVMATLWLCRAKWVSHRDVQVIVGHWVHHMMFLRSAMCTLERVFTWMHHPAVHGKRKLVLPRRVRAELLGAAVLAPLLRCDISKPLARSVVATDATLTRGAAVIGRMSPVDSIFMWLRSDRPLYPMQFLPGLIDQDMFVMSHSIAPDYTLQELIAGIQFSLRAAYDFRTVRHVNCQELLAWVTGLKAALRDPSLHGTRLSFLIDSAVVVNILRKGRTSSRILNGVLKRSLIFVIMGNVTVQPLWIQSKTNPSDDPTRHTYLRRASEVSENVRAAVLHHVRQHPWIWEAARLTWTDAGTLSPDEEHEMLQWVPHLPDVPEYLCRFVQFQYDATLGYPGEGPPQRSADLRSRVLPITEERYRTRLEDLKAWMSSEGLPSLSSLIEHRMWGPLDCVATAYVQRLHDIGSPLSHGLWTLAAIHYFYPACQTKIPQAWLTQRQWQRREPGHYRCPMPPRMVIALAAVGWVLGRHRFSLAILLGYAGFSEHLTICIAQSKTSTRSSRIQSVLVTDHLVTLLAEAMIRADASSAPLVP